MPIGLRLSYIRPITVGLLLLRKSLTLASLVKLARKHDPEGSIIDRPMVVPDVPAPPPPPGPPGIRSRGGTFPPVGGNYADPPEPTGVIVTVGGKELRTGYTMMLSRMCRGTPEERSRELQMARGKFKKEPCMHEFNKHGCNAGKICLFSHENDDEEFVDAEVSEVRHRIFSELSRMGFSLPPPILYEIGELSLDASRDAEEAIRRHRRPEPIAKQMPRPRMHANSRSPKGSSRSSNDPEWGSGKCIESKGKGKGGTMELADDPRLRDHTVGDDEEPSDQEVSDHNENKENDVLLEQPACDYDVQSELLQQPAAESNDAAMEDDTATIHA